MSYRDRRHVYLQIPNLVLLRKRPETTHAQQRLPLNANALGVLQRPLRRIKTFDEAETVFVMVRQNYKLYANIGFSK